MNGDETLIYQNKNGKTREIPSNKYFINRRTSVGEDAELYEIKPYGGKKLLDWKRVIGRKSKEK